MELRKLKGEFPACQIADFVSPPYLSFSSNITKTTTKQNIKVIFFVIVVKKRKKALLSFHMICLPSVSCTPRATNVDRKTESIKKKKKNQTKKPQISNTDAARNRN